MKNTLVTDPDKIKHYIVKLRLESRKILVRSDLLESSGMIIDSDENSMTILYTGKFAPQKNMINIQFNLDGDTIFGFISVYKNFTNRLVVGIPKELEIRSIRKFPRTDVYGHVHNRFYIISDGNPDKEVTSSSAPPQLAKIFWELEKNVPDIKKILMMIGSEVNKIGSVGEIKILKDEEKYTEEVGFVVKYKKAFWLPNTNEAKTYIKEIPDQNIINFGMYFKEMKQLGWQDSRISEEILKRRTNYNQQNILSIIVVPIMLFENVIGQISVNTSQKSVKNLRITDVYYLKALADIVSEALTKAKLFKLDTGVDYLIDVTNLSASGASLEVKSRYILKFLHQGLRIKAGLKFSGRIVETISEIRRIDFHEESSYVAIKFIEISTKDQDFIEDYVKKHIDFLRSGKTPE